MIQIDKDIPMPDGHHRMTEWGAAARKLEVGNSLYCANETQYDTVRRVMHSRGWRYVSRVEKTGWRVWRKE